MVEVCGTTAAHVEGRLVNPKDATEEDQVVEYPDLPLL
jgi:hypothetical protein